MGMYSANSPRQNQLAREPDAVRTACQNRASCPRPHYTVTAHYRSLVEVVLQPVEAVDMKLVVALALVAVSPLFAQQSSPIGAAVREAIHQELRRAIVESVANSTALRLDVNAAASKAVRAEVARRVQVSLDRKLAKRRTKPRK